MISKRGGEIESSSDRNRSYRLMKLLLQQLSLYGRELDGSILRRQQQRGRTAIRFGDDPKLVLFAKAV
jgi:hypothetical protein